MNTTMDSASSTDRVRRQITVRAPRARVWRALTSVEEFGTWFGAKLTGSFQPGGTVRGPLTIKGYEHVTVEMQVERVEPEALLAFRWHPYAIDPKVDYSSEPTTLITFELSEQAGGTEITVTEAGFDRLPAGRRDLAFRMNDDGWRAQLENIERYLSEQRA
jgi:uncharacterized protein YndB with AHSA1/START domain